MSGSKCQRKLKAITAPLLGNLHLFPSIIHNRLSTSLLVQGGAE
jgi:hypothetical protein